MTYVVQTEKEVADDVEAAWWVTVTKRFRYKIVYRVDNTLVRVIAVRHPRQHPTAWMSRI